MIGPRDDEGASAIELAVLAPVLLVVIFSIVQAGLWAYGRNVALDAAEHGVSELRTVQPAQATPAECASVESATTTYAQKLGGSGLVDASAAADYARDVGGGCPQPVGGQNVVHVTVSGHVVSLVPGLTLTVKRTASGRIEQFQNDD